MIVHRSWGKGTDFSDLAHSFEISIVIIHILFLALMDFITDSNNLFPSI